MIVYEVNLTVREDVYADYRAWLAVHVEEMLALPGFVAAEILELREPPAPEGMREVTVHYRLVDDAALKRYLAEHAPRMREAGVRRFGDAFTATRRVLAGEPSVGRKGS
jgi:antibiotic biosynthesis monooxygenase (ABM) superfamily enzyme